MSRPTAPRFRRTTGVLLLGMSMAVTACGTGGRVGSSTGGSRDPITRNLIEAMAQGSAFMIVQQFRPRWLSIRTQATPVSGPAYAHVFVDELYFGPLESLEQISSNEIERIEYLNARDATTHYGTGYLGGIIRVIIR